MSVSSNFDECKAMLLRVAEQLYSQKLVNQGQYDRLKSEIESYDSSYFATDTTDILNMLSGIRNEFDPGKTLYDLSSEVKADLCDIFTSVAQSIDNSVSYGYVAAAKEQAVIVSEQATNAAESVAADIKDMSIPYAVGAGIVGLVAAPIVGPAVLPTLLVPASSVIVPAAAAVAGYSYKKIDNFFAGIRSKLGFK